MDKITGFLHFVSVLSLLMVIVFGCLELIEMLIDYIASKIQ